MRWRMRGKGLGNEDDSAEGAAGEVQSESHNETAGISGARRGKGVAVLERVLDGGSAVASA